MISHFVRREAYHDVLNPNKPGLRRGFVRDFMRIYDLDANPDGAALTGVVEISRAKDGI
jgi:hypothetical protein